MIIQDKLVLICENEFYKLSKVNEVIFDDFGKPHKPSMTGRELRDFIGNFAQFQIIKFKVVLDIPSADNNITILDDVNYMDIFSDSVIDTIGDLLDTMEYIAPRSRILNFEIVFIRG